MASRTRRVVATDRLRQAQQQLRAVNVSIARHETGCYQCSHTGGLPAKCCDTGWELHKAAARLRADIRGLMDAPAARVVQEGLW